MRKEVGPSQNGKKDGGGSHRCPCRDFHAQCLKYASDMAKNRPMFVLYVLPHKLPTLVFVSRCWYVKKGVQK
jgi:hypothetical protein